MPSFDPPAVRLYVLPGLDEAIVEEEAARATSGELWRVLDAGTTYEDLTTALRSEYGGQLERAAADVDTFLAALRERGLQPT
jgi:hypothetical protein